MSIVVILFLAGLTALAFVVVAVRRGQPAGPLRGILLLVAAAMVVYVGWIFFSSILK
jgi:hypothetical protein